VSFTITALAGPPGSASGGKGSSRPHIKNIASRVLAQQGGLQPQSSSLGELWSVQLQVGARVAGGGRHGGTWLEGGHVQVHVQAHIQQGRP
jgi:hypothetical protein